VAFYFLQKIIGWRVAEVPEFEETLQAVNTKPKKMEFPPEEASQARERFTVASLSGIANDRAIDELAETINAKYSVSVIVVRDCLRQRYPLSDEQLFTRFLQSIRDQSRKFLIVTVSLHLMVTINHCWAPARPLY
jgi:hypothetical protein